MRSLGALFALSGLLAGSAFASGTGNFVKPPMILVEAGVYCPDESVGRQEAPETERGYIDLIEGEAAVEFHTTVVPGQLTMGFGMRFKLEDGVAPVLGRVIVTHPPYGEPPVTRESYAISIESSDLSMTGFDFDSPYEIQFGTWTLAIEVDGEILLSQEFEVVPPDLAPVTIDMCEGPAILS